MKAITITAIMLIFVLAFAGLALALPADKVQERITALQERIDSGIKAGIITPVLARELNFKLDSVRKRFKAVSGTPAMTVEYRELMKRLDIIETETPKTPPLVEQTPEARIESRMDVLKASIDQGGISGTIVAFEARALHAELQNIRKDFEAAKKGRPLTPPEITRITAKLNRLAIRIEKYKLNRARH